MDGSVHISIYSIMIMIVVVVVVIVAAVIMFSVLSYKINSKLLLVSLSWSCSIHFSN